MHLIPLIILLVDFVFNSYSFPIRHLMVTFVMGAIYLIINQIHACSEGPVYQVYECGNIWLPFVAFAILAVVHLAGHLIWKFIRVKKLK